MKNKEIRVFAKEKGIYLWQIAEALKIPDSSFSRKLRNELSLNEKAIITEIIKKKAGEKK